MAFVRAEKGVKLPTLGAQRREFAWNLRTAMYPATRVILAVTLNDRPESKTLFLQTPATRSFHAARVAKEERERTENWFEEATVSHDWAP